MTLTCIIGIAFNLFVFELNDTLNLEIVIASIDLAAYPGLTFLYFYLSEWITSDLLDISDVFYNSSWYYLPLQHQKLLVLPIMRAGRDLRLKSLGLFDCSLAVFASVM